MHDREAIYGVLLSAMHLSAKISAVGTSCQPVVRMLASAGATCFSHVTQQLSSDARREEPCAYSNVFLCRYGLREKLHLRRPFSIESVCIGVGCLHSSIGLECKLDRIWLLRDQGCRKILPFDIACEHCLHSTKAFSLGLGMWSDVDISSISSDTIHSTV